MAKKRGEEEHTCNEPRGGFLGIPTPRPTTLGLRLSMERLRSARRGQDMKGKKLEA